MNTWSLLARRRANFVERPHRARRSVLAIVAFALASCGGGGGGSSGGSSPVLAVSTTSVSATAQVGQIAPTQEFAVTVGGLANGQKIYLSVTYTGNGIDRITDTGSSLPDLILIQFRNPASLGAGTYEDTVRVEACTDRSCTRQISGSPQTVQVTYTVTPTFVQLISLSPSRVTASDPTFVLTLTGSNFSAQATVQWNGSDRPTTYLSESRLSAQIPATDIADPGSATVSVYDTTHGSSNTLVLTIERAPLSLRAISPTQVVVGGRAFMLTVIGAGFTSTSTVKWNGTVRSTTFVSTSELIAQIGAADIAAVGSAQVTVADPSSVIGTTPPMTLSIIGASTDAVAFQINPAHTGSVTFSSVTFPSGPAWTVDVGGSPSYALIAQGMVYVTVKLADGNSQLIALSQSDGHVVWGPVDIVGVSNAAYDNGRVFAISSQYLGPSMILAFDATTGAALWSTVLTRQYYFASAPTAANGLVFAGAGKVYAINQATGAMAWNAFTTREECAPAVTVDGVYISFSGWAVDFRPATGEQVWSYTTGSGGSVGASPVVANGLLYAPLNSGTYNGSVFDAETGAVVGSYVSDNPGAFTNTMGYFLQSGTLRGVTLSGNSTVWSFAGDGQLVTSPIVVNGYIFVGSSAGNIYALDGATGQQVWQQSLGSPLPPGPGWWHGPPLAGLAAGDGLLVVPAGTTVTAYLLSATP